MNIRHEAQSHKGVFIMDDNGTTAGELYYMTGAGRIVIDHTEVEPAYEGKGVGKQLVAAAVAYARQQQIKIVPVCPFAKAVFERTPDYADVWSKP
jgi:predicted GNAT family acetyltransferase